MDAIQLLKDDHQAVKDLFKKFEEQGDRAYKAKQEIVARIVAELRVHEAIEEEIFYPALKENASKDGRATVLEGIEEHHVADLVMEEILDLDPQDEAYDAKVKVLKENVEHHIEEEESEMFEEAEDVLAEDLDRLGEEMMARKRELLRAEGIETAA